MELYNMMIQGLLLLAAALLALGGTQVVKYLSNSMKLVHPVNDRSLHSSSTPHGGGLGVVISGSVVGMWLLTSFSPVSLINESEIKIAAILVLGLVIAFLGLIDDIWLLSIRLRLTIQAVVLIGLLILLGSLPDFIFVHAPFFLDNNGLYISGWLLSILVFVAGLWWINLFNFMDGIDGIAGTQTILMLTTGACLAAWSDANAINSASWLMMLCISAATIGFMILNWSPARIFLGDVGSYWLGFMILSLALLTIQEQWLSYSTWLILGVVFIADSTVTLLIRIVRGDRWYEAHRNHAYQHLSLRLTETGKKRGIDKRVARTRAHRRINLGVIAISLVWLAPLASLTLYLPNWEWVWVLVAYLPLIIGAIIFGAGRPGSQ